MITREVAQVMMSKLMSATDESLANMLEEFPESHFRNYCIVTQEELEKEKTAEYRGPIIETLNDF